MTDTDPASVMAAIVADTRALDAAGAELGRKIKELADAEIAYGDAFDAALVGQEGGSKELREARARQQVPVELRGRVRRVKAEVESLKEYVRIKGNTVSARQSLLAALRDEMRGQ